MDYLFILLTAWGITTLALLAGTGVLHLLPRLGNNGKRASAWLCGGIPLDLVVGFFTALPWVIGVLLGGWLGLAGTILGQYSALVGWTLIHELAHPEVRRGPRIVTMLNKAVGTMPNLLAVFWTSLAVPVFTLIRIAEHLVYPPLVWLVKFPRYDQRQWVNVTRHKFDGLVGHDRIWCLYCDWMTGVWSLGGDMLRNVESFWCPIRFASPEKCANCRHDYPDLDNGWVPHDSDMSVVHAAMVEHYGEDGSVQPRAWWGHPSRQPTQVTHNGKPLPPKVSRLGVESTARV